MTLTAIDATISNDRRNLDLREYIKDAAVIKASKEFKTLVNRTTLIAIDKLQQVEDVMSYVEAAMVIALRMGYKVKEQEIGSQELEAFFGETTNEIPEAVRAASDKTAQREEVSELRGSGE